uniref:Thyroglobulin type-1 domain-containing protein n=1 Tax=Capra hircus TaxID=9925 RepID=A0A8C2NGV7_CAPHI
QQDKHSLKRGPFALLPPTVCAGLCTYKQNKLILNTALEHAALPIINPWLRWPSRRPSKGARGAQRASATAPEPPPPLRQHPPTEPPLPPSDEATDTKDTTSPENVSPESSEITQEQLLDNFHLMTESSEDLPILWNAISNYESLKALEISDVKKWKEPCQRELYKVLDRLAREQQKAGDKLYKFYLPNCNKNGFYHSKQCETSLEGEPGLCWCVYPWSGKRILGSVAIRGDPQCQQYFNLQN